MLLPALRHRAARTRLARPRRGDLVRRRARRAEPLRPEAHAHRAQAREDARTRGERPRCRHWRRRCIAMHRPSTSPVRVSPAVSSVRTAPRRGRRSSRRRLLLGGLGLVDAASLATGAPGGPASFASGSGLRLLLLLLLRHRTRPRRTWRLRRLRRCRLFRWLGLFQRLGPVCGDAGTGRRPRQRPSSLPRASARFWCSTPGSASRCAGRRCSGGPRARLPARARRSWCGGRRHAIGVQDAHRGDARSTGRLRRRPCVDQRSAVVRGRRRDRSAGRPPRRAEDRGHGPLGDRSLQVEWV